VLKKKNKRLQWEGFAEKGFKSVMKERVGDEKLIIIGVAVRGIEESWDEVGIKTFTR